MFTWELRQWNVKSMCGRTMSNRSVILHAYKENHIDTELYRHDENVSLEPLAGSLTHSRFSVIPFVKFVKLDQQNFER